MPTLVVSAVAAAQDTQPAAALADSSAELVLEIEAHPFLAPNNFPHGIPGATVSVGETSCTTDAEGRCVLSGLTPGSATLEMSIPNCVPETGEFELVPGLHEVVTFVERDTCPEGMACLVQADAYLELHIAASDERARLGTYVVGVVAQDGTVTAMSAGPWSTNIVEFEAGGAPFTLRFHRTPGAFGDRVEAVVTGADRLPVLEGGLFGYDESTSPGCETLCASPGAGFVAIHFAHSWLGDPLGLCQPASCDGE